MKKVRNILCAIFFAFGMFILCANENANANESIERLCVASVFWVIAWLIHIMYVTGKNE